jgi:glycosyltransferase involved in cell wall biosynthesis
MRVLILSTVHRWNDPRVFHKEACTLAKEHDVILAAVGDGPEEIIKGVRVIRMGTWTSRAERIKLWFVAYRRIFRIKPDVIHFHDPELALLLLPLAFLSNAKIVCDIHEDPSSGYGRRPWIPKFLRWILGGFFYKLLRMSPRFYDAVVLAEESYREHFAPSSNLFMLRNYAIIPDPDVPHFNRFDDFDPQKEFRLIYVGILMEYRGAFEMIRIVEKVARKYPRVTLDLVGRTEPADLEPILRREADRLEGKIRFHGYVDWSKMDSFLRKAHIGLVPLKPLPNLTGSLVTKLFDYMIYGLPFVASNFPLWVQFLKENPAGVTANPLDVDAFADAVCKLAESPELLKRLSRNGYDLVRRKFSWQKEGETLLKIYRDFV